MKPGADLKCWTNCQLVQLNPVKTHRTKAWVLLLVSLLVVACAPLSLGREWLSILSSDNSTPAPALVLTPSLADLTDVSPGVPTLPPSPTSSPTPTYTDLWVGPGDLVVFPQPVYAGDWVSFQVTVHNGGDKALNHVEFELQLGPSNPKSGPRLATGRIGHVPAHGQGRTTLEWTWNTTGTVGLQTISLLINPAHTLTHGDENPNNNHLTTTLDVLPATARPPREAEAKWDQAQSRCCTFHYITGTAAERDLGTIMEFADADIAEVASWLGLSPTPNLQIYLIPRVVGHGGFTAGTITLSYLDRNYAAGGVREVLRHEAIHALEPHWARGGEHHIMMGEGLAVYLTGGHFKSEPIPERAAGLLQLDRYIPLGELAPNFYSQQHEIGYLEAASFVQFLSETYGFDRLRILFSTFHTDPGDTETTVLDKALNQVYGRSLIELEADWRAYLRTLTPTSLQVRDLLDSVLFYDTVRAYQKAFDPWAHFQTPWLPEITAAERRGIIADYYRHPNAPVNLALETMLIAANQALLNQNYPDAERHIEAVNSVINADGAFVDPLAVQYRRVVEAVGGFGYEALQVRLNGRIADVWGIQATGSPGWLSLVNTPQGWQLSERASRFNSDFRFQSVVQSKIQNLKSRGS